MKAIHWIIVSGVMASAMSPAEAQCVSTNWGGGSSGLNFVSSMGGTLTNAMNVWANACGDQAPPLSTSISSVGGLLNITTQHLGTGFACAGHSDACACSQRQEDGFGNTTGGTISVFDYAANGADCRAYLESNLAHEMGHFLGFTDVTDSTCSSNVMYYRANLTAGVTIGQCDTLDSMWTIENEDPCDDPQPPQGCDNGQDPPGSPLVIDLESNGFRFTSPDSGVEFDLDSDGVAERLSWVADPRDAFLFWDVNGNRSVDSGKELFGNFTVLLNGSRAVHGFEALAELDLPSQAGNGDGVIDESDWGYHLLELWLDWNLNGVSDEGELVSLAKSPLRSISLNYMMNRRKDRFGNMLTYWSKVRLLHSGKELPGWAVDVFFQHPIQ